MSDTPDLRIVVKNFRAVCHADIIVNGITVVAGENGSGKSSISKLLYFLYKTVAEYEDIVKKNLFDHLRAVRQLADIVSMELRYPHNQETRDTIKKEIRELRKTLIESEFLEEEADKWVELISKIEHVFVTYPKRNIPLILSNRKEERIRHILQDIVESDDDSTEILDLFIEAKELVRNRFSEAKRIIDLRPISIFNEQLETIFTDGQLPEAFEVIEYGDLIIAHNKSHLSIPYNIQNAIYIDSPMMFHAESSSNVHWENLSDLLIKKGSETHAISELINSEIIQGDVITEEGAYSADDFKFKRIDGALYNLLDVATGIKSFAMLQLLLKNGSITDKTLMIIDEPESNLHPQWIIEYARIIVMLNKQIGVKFFLATHNPDMVSAIRFISEKEGTLENVNFYLAKKLINTFQYQYLDLDKNIDPIFESFNIALDRINKYGI